MKNKIFLLAAIGVVFLMISTATAVPSVNNDKIDDILNVIKENDDEKEDDDPTPEPQFLGALWAIMWICIWIWGGWVPPWPF